MENINYKFSTNYVMTHSALDDLIKKAQWMKDNLNTESSLRASDFDDLNISVRQAFNAYTR